MSIFNKDWGPTKNQKDLAEKFICPFVVILRIFTSWYMVLIWAFLLPFLTGQGIIYSIALAIISAGLSWYVWRETEKV